MSNVGTLRLGSASRSTEAAFGELQVPIVGADNRSSGFYSLSVSASGRYDRYSDFGGTFNPKFGLTYGPLSWARVRGSWGRSFQAPSLADTADAAGNSIAVLPFVVYPSPTLPGRPGQAQLFLTGGGNDLRPQKATVWSAGIEVEPPILPGLLVKASYYNISFRDLIGTPPIFNPALYYAVFGDTYVLSPTAAQVAAFGAQAAGGASIVAPYTQFDGQVYSIADGRRQNQANANTDGLDLSAAYNRDTGFGSIYANVNGSYILSLDQQAKAGAPTISSVDLLPRLRLAATLGVTIGALRAQATLNHQNGFTVAGNSANLNQTRIDSYDVVNLFFEYKLPASGMLRDTSLTLTVENVADTDPPLFNGTNGVFNGYGIGNPLGRFLQLGVRKSF